MSCALTCTVVSELVFTQWFEERLERVLKRRLQNGIC